MSAGGTVNVQVARVPAFGRHVGQPPQNGRNPPRALGRHRDGPGRRAEFGSVFDFIGIGAGRHVDVGRPQATEMVPPEWQPRRPHRLAFRVFQEDPARNSGPRPINNGEYDRPAARDRRQSPSDGQTITGQNRATQPLPRSALRMRLPDYRGSQNVRRRCVTKSIMEGRLRFRNTMAYAACSLSRALPKDAVQFPVRRPLSPENTTCVPHLPHFIVYAWGSCKPSTRLACREERCWY